MRITKLHLRGNIRLLNKGTYELIYTPESATQLILGNNGSGKSTLLEELSPLPANKKSYTQGGIKHVYLEHEGHSYQTISDFTTGSGKHTFIKNGDVLHEAGTQSIQRQWVERELNYTAEFHRLLLGKVKFTQLTAQKRKEFFTMLCPTDMNFAMKTYQDVLKAKRNAVGALQHTHTKLEEYANLILGEEDVEQLKKVSRESTEKIRLLSEQKELHVQWDESTLQHSKELAQRLQQKALSVLDDPEIEKISNVHVDDMTAHRNQLAQDLQGTQSTIRAHKQEYDSIDELLNDRTLEGKDIPTIKQELADIVRQLDKIHPHCTKYEWHSDPSHALETLNEITDTLQHIYGNIEPNPDMSVYNKINMQELKAKLDENRRKYNYGTSQLNTLQSKVATLQQHENKVECPQCSFSWVPGLSDKQLASYQQQIEKIAAGIEQLDKDHDTLTQTYEAATAWKNLYQQYTQLVNQMPVLAPLWQHLNKEKLVLNSPTAMSMTLTQYRQALKYQKQYKTLTQDKERVEHVLGLASAQGNTSREKLVERLHVVDKTISELVEHERVVAQELNVLDRKLTTIRATFVTLGQIEEMEGKLADLKTMQLKHQKNEYLDNEIHVFTERAASVSSRLTQSMNYLNLHDEYKRSVEELEQDIDAYTQLEKSLSPTQGIIAESLGGFISTFIGQMNDVIKFIWSTPLKILPCFSDAGDLDYKFPIHTYEDKYNGTDVTEGSVGEMEVIDFAFLVMTKFYLGLEEWPLYMDEVGHHFSEQHRATLYSYVKLLIESDRISQVFIVSHFPSTHGSLTHADKCVIDPTGTMTDSSTNAVLDIT